LNGQSTIVYGDVDVLLSDPGKICREDVLILGLFDVYRRPPDRGPGSIVVGGA